MDERASNILFVFIAFLLIIYVYLNIPKTPTENQETDYEKGWLDACRSVHGKMRNDNGIFRCASISEPYGNCSYGGDGFTITSGTSYEIFSAYMAGMVECRCPLAVIDEYATSQIYDPDYGMLRNASQLIRCFIIRPEGGG